METKKHKIFVCFHHGNPDIDPFCGQNYKEEFERLFDYKFDAIISNSVEDGDIDDDLDTDYTRTKIRDNFIADATVTIVLIGPETWKRKHVDWEISSSIKDTKNNSRCGLIGILLPTYPDYNKEQNTYYPYTIPPRLYDNIIAGYASIHVWNTNPTTVANWIHEAYLRRFKIEPDNSYPIFKYNKSSLSKDWKT